MNTIAIFPEFIGPTSSRFIAVSGARQSYGSTAGQALDALTAALESSQESALIVVQAMRPDEFFSGEQIDRLQSLMAEWRAAHSERRTFDPAKGEELEMLVEAELQAAIRRAETMRNPSK